MMTSQKPPSQLPGLLGKLGKLTAIRDLELLEQSLLKTLGPLLGVLDTALYRTDETLNVDRVLFHHRSKTLDMDGVARMVESIEEATNLQDLPPEVIALTDNVRLLGKPCTRKCGDELIVAYPLLGGEDICGYFVFQRDREVSPVEDMTIRGVLEVFSNYYALLDISQRDRLTGLLNRQALENSFDRIWNALSQPVFSSIKQGRRTKPSRNYWLAVIDIDHFKTVNDSFGHIVGDEVLLLVSRLLGQAFRTSDLLYRYGGEEFIAIIAADDERLAAQVFERVRKMIEERSFPRIDKLTISVGYARADPNILPQEVLGRADRSLYEAKNQGRNRVCQYEDLIRRGIFEEATYGDAELF
ncbi:MAG: GGDEF domain-containing protein [Azonexus sp.]|nr:GGDEF domain-containing protein [Azonexus sp.]